MIPVVGQKVPDFKGVLENDKPISNKSLLGKKYILFFYPKDDSPGCTKEACSVRDHFKEIKNMGYEVYGISPDTTKKHQKFIDKYEFQYSLISDSEKEIIEAFNLWGPKKFMGREIVGVYRTTFIVDEKGMIEGVIDKVKTKDHGKQILDLISEKVEMS
jgi:peroxiredoxin Q/BCP